MISKYIFIVGTGRCGTRWLNEWILKHSRCFGGPESHFFIKASKMLESWPGSGPIPWLNNSESTMIRLIRNFAGDFYSHRMIHPKDCLVDCTPDQYDHRNFIKQVFPHAKFVHIYRDGKYFVWSVTRSTWGKKITIKNWSLRWVKLMEDMANSRNDQVNIKYEDLLENPHLSKKITEFAEISHHGDIIPWVSPINTKNSYYDPDKWKALSDSEKEDMKIMNNQLINNGYSPVV